MSLYIEEFENFLKKAVAKSGPLAKDSYHVVFEYGTIARFDPLYDKFPGFHNYEFPEHRINPKLSFKELRRTIKKYQKTNEENYKKVLEFKTDKIEPELWERIVNTALILLMDDEYPHPGNPDSDTITLPILIPDD